MSKELVYAFAAHLLNRQEYKEEIIENNEPWLELSQYCQEILLYQISKDSRPNFSQKCKFVEEVEYTYQFMHPAIAKTYKYTYSDKLSISYLGNKNSFFSHEFQNGTLSNTTKQIVLIGIASAMIYLKNKGVSHYCLDVNHIILDKMQLPKLACSGIPSAFKPNDWNDNISELQSFGEFVQTILSDQNNIPAAIQNIIDKCINIQSDADNDLPTFDEFLSILSNKKNYLKKVDEDTVSKYIMWLDFQDKFPCDYFFELNKKQSKSLFDAINNRENSSEFSSFLFYGQKEYPVDVFGAVYFLNIDKIQEKKKKEKNAKNNKNDKMNDEINIIKTFWKYYGCPQWLKDLNENIESAFNLLDNKEVAFNPSNCFHIKNLVSRSRLKSKENDDVQFVIDSYLNGTNDFPKSKQAAFYHVKKLLSNDENNTFLLIQLGQMYENGIGAPTNYKKAIDCFELAQENEMDVMNHIKRVRSKQERLENQISNLNEECKEYLDKADSNNFNEIMYVAFSFLHGLNGFPSSQYHAYQYYKKAAETDPYIFFIIGNLFRFGIVFSQNIIKAQKYYTLSSLNGCLRGQFYDGLMQLCNYYPAISPKKYLNCLDKHYFEYKNNQGNSNPFNYCKMIYASQMHFPLMTLDFDMVIKSKYKNYDERLKPRRQKNMVCIKQSIIFDDNTSNGRNFEIDLSDTSTQITLWVIFYQLKTLADIGIKFKGLRPIISHFADSNSYYAITGFKSIHWYKADYKKPITELAYNELSKWIPKSLRELIKVQIIKNTIDESLSYFENNLLSMGVCKDSFESFIRKCKSFVPLDSAKILISEKTEKAESGDKECLQECARNYFYGIKPFPINYSESFRLYQVLSGDNYNDSNAQMWLGIMFSKAVCVKQNIQKALDYFKKAADQDNFEAKFNYALFLEYYNRKLKDAVDPRIPYMDMLLQCNDELHQRSLFEIGKLKESHLSLEYGRTESIKYYEKASSLGNIESTRRLYHVYKKLEMKEEIESLMPLLITINDPKYIYIVAQSLYDANDYENSIKYAKMMLPTHNPKIRKLYADHLLYGHGIKKDVETAKKLYMIASKKNPSAMVALANIYAEGIDCEKDMVKARKIYYEIMESAQQESVYRKLYCDFCEEHGFYRAAFNFHFRIAVNDKMKESQYKVGVSLINPVHGECKKRTKKGFEFLTKSADQHYPIAAYELGKSYIYGEHHQKRNFEKGEHYLKMASSLDFDEATFLLGLIYRKGIGTIPDNEAADEYFLKLLNKNSENAHAKYYLFKNKDLSPNERMKYLSEAADLGFDKAQFKYGKKLAKYSYYTNREKYNKGVEYISMAMNQNNKKAMTFYQLNIAPMINVNPEKNVTQNVEDSEENVTKNVEDSEENVTKNVDDSEENVTKNDDDSEVSVSTDNENQEVIVVSQPSNVE